MTNMHMHLYVADLDASRSFYERFFGAGPVKVKPGYLKFLPDFAPLNLALSPGQATRGSTIDHLGIQVDSTEAVQTLLHRVKAVGIPVREEIGTDCCFANQDKFWVTDPDGLEWEVYHLNFDLEDDVEAVSAASKTNCCVPALARLGKRP